VQEAIEIERLTPEEVVSSAREQGIADLTEIRYGVLEPDGTFSFVRMSDGEEHRPPEKAS
jgi:uncharacterized membrane protein YcaP (DUF421 family)